MELKDFIKESLVQIANGISEANEQLQHNADSCVNPNSVKVYSNEAKAYGRVDPSQLDQLPLVELVEFDVAVEAASGTQTQAGLKLSVAAISLGADGKSNDTRSSVSRIKFKIPMVYPYGKII